ncbi:transposase family protein [Actinomyces bowdenii]|uniref:Transposase n=1 Tax=Actinomyces bowdenii TaxID=131109 RepID=A0A853ENW9_9ACTO|nr:transposase family protein [Actinomyces bowdenii]MBF0697839.1 transposase [Actinomyces bowdenii]NYS70012.1 transposase [Actinomyces bowdenii]
MPYQATAGLCDNDIDELVERIGEVLESRDQSLLGHRLGIRRQAELTLILLRHSIPQALTADMYGVSQPTVSRAWRRMVPLLTHVPATTGTPLAQTVAQGSLLLIDGATIPTGNRPAAGKQIEKANYSGKHHAQCLSVQVAATTDGTLVAVSEPVPGSCHDSAALGLCGWDEILAGADWIADTAYTAHGALTPIKKTPGRQRLEWEKEFNRAVSSTHAAIEHIIATLKKWKIPSTGYHHRLTELPSIITLVSKLELYRTSW